MLYTRKGDGGESGVFGTKDRLPKDSPLYEALGALDELNSLIGLCRAKAANAPGVSQEYDVVATLRTAQEHLFIAQAELAGTDKTLTQEHVSWVEKTTDSLESLAGNPHSFVLPGATELSGMLDVARAVARRTERATIRAKDIRAMSPTSYAYLNRLSSVLYALARYAAFSAKVKESGPSYQ